MDGILKRSFTNLVAAVHIVKLGGQGAERHGGLHLGRGRHGQAQVLDGGRAEGGRGRQSLGGEHFP